MGLPQAPFVPWPEPGTLYLLGRHAVVAVLSSLPTPPRRLWLPDYFCHDVVGSWRGLAQIAMYADNPAWPEPDWSTLQPASDDIVLAINYFGIRSGEPWQRWHEKHSCCLVEDHSHDPVSGWALHSRADYGFSSLRKTIPVPDGAILWSPRGHPLPKVVDEDLSGSALKLAAMVWKREYLEGRAVDAAKPLYRQWQRAGEDAFDRSTKLSSVSPYSRQYLTCGMPLGWRRQRAANVRRLLRQREPSFEAQPLFTSWPTDSVPMAAVFRFTSKLARDSARKRLEESDIYCPVHWPAPAHCDPAVRDMADTILTIPTDHRYGKADMDRIASVLYKKRSVEARY
jgi:hypothetical protein